MLTFGTLDVGSVYNDRQYERELTMFLLIQFSSAQGSRLLIMLNLSLLPSRSNFY